MSSSIDDFLARSTAEVDPYPPQIPFTAEEYAGRLERLRAAMQADGIDLVLLTSPEAMCWLHGYALRWYKAHSPKRWRPLACTAVHVDHDRFIMFEGAEHTEMLRRTSISTDNRFLPRYRRDEMLDFIFDELRAEGWLRGRIGLEDYSYLPNPAVRAQIAAGITGAGAEVVDATDPVRAVRRTKSPQEIAYVEEAARICDAGLRHLDATVATGMTELEAWSTMLAGMAAAGGEPAALHELAAVGTGGVGHAISGRRVIRKGDRVGVDPCGVFNRYHANVSRTYYFGDPPGELVELSGLLWGAFDVLCKTAAAGTPVRDVNRALREYYVDCDLWKHKENTWLGGYELGISFPPDWVGNWIFTVAEEDPEGSFEDGMVTNYESIVSVAVLDTVVYGPGGARTLSALPHDVVVVDR